MRVTTEAATAFLFLFLFSTSTSTSHQPWPAFPPVIPPVVTETGLHTPSQEWADKATTALRDPDTTGTADSVNPTTHQLLSSTSASAPPPVVRAPSGDPRVPGAFQSDDQEHHSTGMDMLKEKMSDAATSVGETAKQYLPQAAQYLPKSVVDTVQGYLRESCFLFTTSQFTSHAMFPFYRMNSTWFQTCDLIFTPAILVCLQSAILFLSDLLNPLQLSPLRKPFKLPPMTYLTELLSPARRSLAQVTTNTSAASGLSPVPSTRQGLLVFRTRRRPLTTNLLRARVRLVLLASQEVPVPLRVWLALRKPSKPEVRFSFQFLSSHDAHHLTQHRVAMGSENATTSLPSAETTGAQPGEHVGAGVGALPGHISESGVARLPDEHSSADNARQAGDSHAIAAATGAGLGIAGVGATAAASKHSEKNVALPGGMDDRTTGVGAGGDLNTHHTQARPAVSPDSQYSQPSFNQDSSKTGVAAVGSSGAAAGSMLAGGGFGGREQGQAQQPVSDSSTVGDSQRSAMQSRGTHTDTAANVAPIPSSAKVDATGKEGERVGRDLKGGALEKETQFAGPEGKKDVGESQKKETHAEKETHKGAPNKVSKFVPYSFFIVIVRRFVCTRRCPYPTLSTLPASP